MAFNAVSGAEDTSAPVDLEPLEGEQDPRVAQQPLAQPTQQQLTPEDAAALASVPGVDAAKAQQLQAKVAARQTPAANVGNGVQVLDPLQEAPAIPAPQYTMQTIPVESSTSSSTSGLDAASVRRLQDDRAKVIQANQAGLDAALPQIKRDAQAAQETAALADARAKQSAQAAIDGATLRDDIERTNKSARAKIQSDVDDYLQQGDKVDSDRVWHRMDTGQKVGYAIAAALSGFGESLQGRGGNPVLAMLTAAEERDMRAQEIGLQAKSRGIQMQESLYGRLVEAGHDKETAHLADLNAKNKTIDDQLAAAQVKAQTAPEQERIASTRAAWQGKMATDQEAFDQHVARTSTSSTVTRKQAVMMDENGNPVQKGASQDNANFLNDVRRMVQGGSVKIVDGQALKDAFAQKRITPRVYEQLQAAERLGQLRKDYAKGIAEYYDSSINSKEADKAQTYLANLNSDIKGQAAMAKGSALTPEEGRHIDTTLPVITRRLPSLGFDGIKTAREEAIAKATGAIDAIVTPVKGNLRPYGLDVPDSSGADLGQPVKQVRHSDGKVYTMYANGEVRVQ